MSAVTITTEQLSFCEPLPPFILEALEEVDVIIYDDWDEAVESFASDAEGLVQLSWLVSRALVPMNRLQLRALKKSLKPSICKKARRIGVALLTPPEPPEPELEEADNEDYDDDEDAPPSTRP